MFAALAFGSSGQSARADREEVREGVETQPTAEATTVGRVQLAFGSERVFHGMDMGVWTWLRVRNGRQRFSLLPLQDCAYSQRGQIVMCYGVEV